MESIINNAQQYYCSYSSDDDSGDGSGFGSSYDSANVDGDNDIKMLKI